MLNTNPQYVTALKKLRANSTGESGIGDFVAILSISMFLEGASQLPPMSSQLIYHE